MRRLGWGGTGGGQENGGNGKWEGGTRRGEEGHYNQDVKQIWRRGGDEDEDKGMLLCCSVTELKYKVP